MIDNTAMIVMIWAMSLSRITHPGQHENDRDDGFMTLAPVLPKRSSGPTLWGADIDEIMHEFLPEIKSGGGEHGSRVGFLGSYLHCPWLA